MGEVFSNYSLRLNKIRISLVKEGQLFALMHLSALVIANMQIEINMSIDRVNFIFGVVQMKLASNELDLSYTPEQVIASAKKMIDEDNGGHYDLETFGYCLRNCKTAGNYLLAAEVMHKIQSLYKKAVNASRKRPTAGYNNNYQRQLVLFQKYLFEDMPVHEQSFIGLPSIYRRNGIHSKLFTMSELDYIHEVFGATLFMFVDSYEHGWRVLFSEIKGLGLFYPTKDHSLSKMNHYHCFGFVIDMPLLGNGYHTLVLQSQKSVARLEPYKKLIKEGDNRDCPPYGILVGPVSFANQLCPSCASANFIGVTHLFYKIGGSKLTKELGMVKPYSRSAIEDLQINHCHGRQHTETVRFRMSVYAIDLKEGVELEDCLNKECYLHYSDGRCWDIKTVKKQMNSKQDEEVKRVLEEGSYDELTAYFGAYVCRCVSNSSSSIKQV